MNYRSDIDGLRAISVISVIIFHTGFTFLSGGFIGVDVFFVISGYLITGLVYKEITAGTFSYVKFYKRRIARLLPALIITLFVILLFGFLFYDNEAYDSLGKEVFFSALGAANILFAQGVNYFAQDEAVRPLIHLWSLGVEEQFYLIWPTLLILLAKIRFRYALSITTILFFISLFLAMHFVDTAPIKAYFQPQYRAFELFIGALTALIMTTSSYKEFKLGKYQRELIAYLALLLIFAPMLLLSKASTFPGLNTLYPIIGASLLIAFSKGTSVSRILSLSPFVFIGLISYPLYLYHQPILSFIYLFDLTSNKYLILTLVFAISSLFAWLTYKYIEKPIRQAVHQTNTSTFFTIASLILSLLIIAVAGLYIAKNAGLGERFKLINPFAYEVSRHHKESFFQHFEKGVNISKSKNSEILLIGDSVLQQYAYPITQMLALSNDKVDSITRGGCVLLKGVNFRDEFSDTPCNPLREEVYKLNKHYKTVVISQLWKSYDSHILNFNHSNPEFLEKWTPFIKSTIEHFKSRADNIILIGYQLKVEGLDALQPSIFLSKEDYLKNLSALKVTNAKKLLKSVKYFNQFASEKVSVLHPVDIWLNNDGRFTLHNNRWSYFHDDIHSGSVSTDFIVSKLHKINLLKNKN